MVTFLLETSILYFKKQSCKSTKILVNGTKHFVGQKLGLHVNLNGVLLQPTTKHKKLSSRLNVHFNSVESTHM